jgi:hypothetical protein
MASSILSAMIVSALVMLTGTTCNYESLPIKYFVTAVRAGCTGQGGLEYLFSPLKAELRVCDVPEDTALRLPLNWIISGRVPNDSTCRTGRQYYPRWIVTKADVSKTTFWACSGSPVPMNFIRTSFVRSEGCGTSAAILFIKDARLPVTALQGTVVPVNVNPDGTITTESGTIISPPPN